MTSALERAALQTLLTAWLAGVPTCPLGLGDDGILHTASHATMTRCSAVFSSGVLAFSPSSDDEDAFLDRLGCIADVGTGGCGFEQQLEASLKALTPSEPRAWTRAGYVPPRFLDERGTIDGDLGQGERANAGFLRPDSVLAILILTDEEDCSVSDYGLFRTDHPRFSDVPLPLRCIAASDPSAGVVRPISRYVDGFLGLRARPNDLVFAAIVGIPQETQSAMAEAPDFERILNHPDMTPRPPTITAEPSCSSLRGVSPFPPIRLVEAARGLSERGAGVSIVSVCSEDYSASSASIVRLVGTRLPPL
jgi:hypothetical protein